MRTISPIHLLAIAAVALLCAIIGFAFTFASPADACAFLGMAAIGMAFLVADADAAVKQSHALPNGAATTQGAGINLGNGMAGDVVADFELVITAPALTTGELADGQTITYSLEHDTVSGFGTVATIPGFASVAVQTGAAGAGAAAQEIPVRLPVDTKGFIRLKTVKAGASNASTKSATLQLKF